MVEASMKNSSSPNFDNRVPPPGCDQPVIDTMVLHYTGMQTAQEALARLCDPQAQVSAHYLIEEDGTLHQLVDPKKRAWHAGVSSWQGREGLNHTSIGVELVNPGHEFGYRAFPDAQIECLLILLAKLKDRFSIPTSRFIGHSDIAPDRKQDPGELFPWKVLAAQGFGVWPNSTTKDKTILAKKGIVGTEVDWLNQSLSAIGYSVPVQAEFSSITETALVAFQRHWRPSVVNGLLDVETKTAMQDVEQQIEADKQLVV